MKLPIHASITALSIFAVLSPITAHAHAKLLNSAPASNAIVQKAPSEVVLRFSEVIELSMSKVEVKNLASGEVVSQGRVTNVGDDRASMRIGLKPLKAEKAKFEISWKAVAKDAHKMPGHIEFTFDPKG